MNSASLALTVAAVTLLSGSAWAETAPHAQAWIATTADMIGREIPSQAGTGVVIVQAAVGSDRRFKSVKLAGVSASPALNAAVLKAARRHRPATPPTELLNRRITLRISAGGAEALAAR